MPHVSRRHGLATGFAGGRCSGDQRGGRTLLLGALRRFVQHCRNARSRAYTDSYLHNLKPQRSGGGGGSSIVYFTVQSTRPTAAENVSENMQAPHNRGKARRRRLSTRTP